jgi:hypothetical protein
MLLEVVEVVSCLSRVSLLCFGYSLNLAGSARYQRTFLTRPSKFRNAILVRNKH